VFDYLPPGRYAIRAIDLRTGLSQYAVAPLPSAGSGVDPLAAVQPDFLPLMYGDRIYEIPQADPKNPLAQKSGHYLRCWSLSDGKEIFCVPLDHMVKYWPDLSYGEFYYESGEWSNEGGELTFTGEFIARELQKGQIQKPLKFTEEMLQVGELSLCHRSHNLAVCISHVDHHHGIITRYDSEIYLTASQGEAKRIAAIEGLKISQIALEKNDETIWHLGVRDNGLQVLSRRNIEHGYNIRTYDVGHRDAGLVTDFKLLPGEKEVALASDDGSFRVLDVESGKELRRLTGLKYVPSYRQLFILAGVAGFWLILWWLATRPKPGTPPQLARLLGYAVFLAGLVQGLLLKGIRDQVDHLHGPTLFAAVGIPSLLAVAGLILLFDARFPKMILLYGILACGGMVACIFWIPS
jgi:hypothetical protein